MIRIIRKNNYVATFYKRYNLPTSIQINVIIEDTGTQGWVTHNGLFGEHVRGLPERMEKLKFGEAL